MTLYVSPYYFNKHYGYDKNNEILSYFVGIGVLDGPKSKETISKTYNKSDTQGTITPSFLEFSATRRRRGK